MFFFFKKGYVVFQWQKRYCMCVCVQWKLKTFLIAKMNQFTLVILRMWWNQFIFLWMVFYLAFNLWQSHVQSLFAKSKSNCLWLHQEFDRLFLYVGIWPSVFIFSKEKNDFRIIYFLFCLLWWLSVWCKLDIFGLLNF